MRIKFLISVIIVFAFSMNLNAQVIFVENFDYPAGDSVQMHGWVTHSSYGLQPMIVSPGLTYTGYPSSGIGNACLLDTNMYEDVSKNFPEKTSGSVYAAFMVKVNYSTATGEYFFHLGATNMGFTYRCRVFVNGDGGVSNVGFGLRKGSSGTVQYTSVTYSYNTTYLLIAKYTFNPSADDDVCVLYVIDGAVPLTEPTTPDLTSSDGSDLSDAGTVAMRNGNASYRPSLIIDGIRISTNWGGVTAIKNISTTTVGDFHLSQNYPNPFNPSTKINFLIPGSGSVSLKVYNSLGQEVSNLVDEQLNRGIYEVDFNGSNLNSGVYFYTLQYKSIEGKYYTDTKKLLLIK